MTGYRYTNEDTWATWASTCGDWAVTCDNCTATATAVWSSWQVDFGATASSITVDTGTTAATWQAWNVTVSGRKATRVSANTWDIPAAPPETAEQHEARVLREAQERTDREAKAAESKAERETAAQRAKTLLLSVLDAQQRAEFEAQQQFHVQIVDKAGVLRTYRIKKGFAGNVKLLNAQGQEAKSYCIHPRDRVPDEDAMVAQMMMLQSDLDGFDQLANETVLIREPQTREAVHAN